jgi:RNA polymerase sigma factor (sigma-70 family)
MIEQARRHEEEALIALYQRALPIVYRFVLARLGRPDLTEDIVSDVFLTMVESIHNLRTDREAGFYAWLIQIAQGKIARTLRHMTSKERKLIPLPDSFITDITENIPQVEEPMATDLISDPVAVQEWRETLDELKIALESLSAEQQTVVVGRFLAGQSVEDLGQALGKRPGAIRALQFRALGVLAKQLGLVRGSQHKRKV